MDARLNGISYVSSEGISAFSFPTPVWFELTDGVLLLKYSSYVDVCFCCEKEAWRQEFRSIKKNGAEVDYKLPLFSIKMNT